MGKRILVVDGAVFMRKMMENILQQNGYEVAGATGSYVEALRLAKTLAPDVVITESLLQETELDDDQNGLTLIATLRRECPAIACIFCSAWEGPYAYEAGAKGFIQKPLKAEAVCRELEKVLNA